MQAACNVPALLAEPVLMKPKIIVEKFALSDIEGFLELSISEYGTSASTSTNSDHIKWKHLNSPFGASTYISLVSSGKIVGRAMLQPRIYCIGSYRLSAANVTDVIIERGFRSPPSNFINVTKAAGDVSGFDLSFHTSNERTFSLYTKLLHFPTPFSLRAFGFPLRFSGFLCKIIGHRIEILDWLTAPFRWLLVITASLVNFAAKLDVSPQTMGDDELDALCTKCLRQSGPLFARTNAFLKWRFLDAPLSPASVYRIDLKGTFIGYIAICKQEMGGLNHLILKDFLLDPNTPHFVQVALRLWLIRIAIKSKADTLFTMVNSFSSIARECVGFPLVPIPDRLLPHATPIFMRFRSSDNKEFEMDKSVHFTMADLDYF